MKFNRLKNKITRLIIFATALSFILNFTSCNKKIYLSKGLKDNEVLKVGENICSIGQMNLVLSAKKSEYESLFNKEIWNKKIESRSDKSITTFLSVVKKQVMDNMTDLYCMKAMAQENNIAVKNDEKIIINEAAKEYYDGIPEENKKTLKVSLEDISELYSDFLLAVKLYDSYTGNINLEISDSKAKVIKVQSIYFKTININNNGIKESVSIEEKQTIMNTAQEVLEKIKSGNDFSTLAAKYSDDDNIQYTFGRGEMIEEYETAAFSLATGEVSNIIETEDGFYIIKCINDYMEAETMENKEKILEEYKREVFLKEYNPFKKNISVEINDNLWRTINPDSELVDMELFYGYFYGIT